MKNWMKSLRLGVLRNWITTVAGVAAGTPLVIEGITKVDWKKIITGLALAALGAVAKDSNKTGVAGGPQPR